jgi:hypothetical protein
VQRQSWPQFGYAECRDHGLKDRNKDILISVKEDTTLWKLILIRFCLPATSVATNIGHSFFRNAEITLFLSVWSMSPWSRSESTSLSLRFDHSSSAFA